MGRKASRENAMKLLFEINYKMDEANDILNSFMEQNELNGDDKEYIEAAVRGTIENIENIDNTIEKYSKGWKINRLAKVDLTVLRLSIYELKYTDTPESIVINEAVELAKKFGTEKSGAFVNGVLSSVTKEGK